MFIIALLTRVKMQKQHKHSTLEVFLKNYRIPRKWQPTPVFLSGKFHEQRILVVYSPWGHKEQDTTKGLRTKEQKETCGFQKGRNRSD